MSGYSRLSVELCALTPLLITSGALLVQRSAEGSRVSAWGSAFGGGVLLGLAVYNHMVAAAVVAGLILGYVVGLGVRCVSEGRSYAALAGLCLGLVPRIVQILSRPAQGMGPLQRLEKNLSSNLYEDLPYLPRLLRGMWDGDLASSCQSEETSRWPLRW